MSVTRIASRYAKSLVELAKDQNKLEVILDDIISFKKALTNRDLYLLVKSPIVNAAKKDKIFKILFSKSYDKMTLAFFDIVLRKGREPYLPEIADEYIKQYKVLKGISIVHITTASPLSDKDLNRIREKLLESEITAKSIEFITKVDSEIIGGFVIKIDDNLYDASVSRKLKELRKEFSDNKFVKAF
jgi:F-type H+-transporting ATPase subunit delta